MYAIKYSCYNDYEEGWADRDSIEYCDTIEELNEREKELTLTDYIDYITRYELVEIE